MNRYEIILKILDKVDLLTEDTPEEILLNTVMFADSQEEAMQKINSFYNVVDILNIKENS